MTARLSGAFSQLSSAGTDAHNEYMNAIEKMMGRYGRPRVEDAIERIITECAYLPPISALSTFIPPATEKTRCPRCFANDGFILEQRPGSKKVYGDNPPMHTVVIKCQHRDNLAPEEPREATEADLEACRVACRKILETGKWPAPSPGRREMLKRQTKQAVNHGTKEGVQ